MVVFLHSLPYFIGRMVHPHHGFRVYMDAAVKHIMMQKIFTIDKENLHFF